MVTVAGKRMICLRMKKKFGGKKRKKILLELSTKICRRVLSEKELFQFPASSFRPFRRRRRFFFSFLFGVFPRRPTDETDASDANVGGSRKPILMKLETLIKHFFVVVCEKADAEKNVFAIFCKVGWLVGCYFWCHNFESSVKVSEDFAPHQGSIS